MHLGDTRPIGVNCFCFVAVSSGLFMTVTGPAYDVWQPKHRDVASCLLQMLDMIDELLT